MSNTDIINQNNNDEYSEYKSFKPEYNIKFIFLCKLLDKIAQLSPKDKSKLVLKFLNAYFKDYSAQHISLYPIFRLLFPKLDRERASYGIQEVFIGQLYANILSLPDQEKMMIKHWKNPNFIKKGFPVGDFVNLIYYIIQKRVTEESEMTINDINSLLNELSTAKNRDERTITMTKIIKNCSGIEQKWIISIILKDLKVGMSHESFFKYLDPRTLDIFNSTSSLFEVTIFLMNPQSDKYVNSFFQLFQPIKPMLVARMKLQEILSQFTGVSVYIESKFDGERIQCHLCNNEVKFFSRNGIDYTYLYGAKLSHLIRSCVNAKSAILDGEIVVWDKIDNKYAPFGENKSVAGDQNEIDKVIVYEIFDVIYLVPPNGEPFSLQNVILSDRKTILNKIITPIPKKLEIVEFKETTSIDEVMKYFTEAMNRGEEGIIIKKKDSIYKPDNRSVDWVKMKSDYIDNIVDTFDLVIIGGYYGEGKRTGLVNEDNVHCVNVFLMGVVKTLNVDSPRNSIILPLVKVGSGFSMDQLASLRRRLNSKWKKYDSRIPPPIFGVWTPAINERPDVYLEDPSDSIILEVKGAEITASESFPTKVTLRFPRAVSVRTDKQWNEAMKYSEILQFYDINTSTQHNHLIKKKSTITDLMSEDIKLEIEKDKKKKKVDKYSKILENFRDTDTSNICKLTNLFQGFQFLVLSLDDIMSINSSKKKALEYSIVEHGGEKVQNYLPTTTHVIAEKIDLKVKNILNLNDINIINSKWVYDCIKNQKLLKVSPIYLTSINSETREEFNVCIDRYNDNFYENVDEESIREIFNNIDVKESNRDWVKCIEELRKEFKGVEWIQQYFSTYK